MLSAAVLIGALRDNLRILENWLPFQIQGTLSVSQMSIQPLLSLLGSQESSKITGQDYAPTKVHSQGRLLLTGSLELRS